MFSLFAYYLSSALIGLSPIRFADRETDNPVKEPDEEKDMLVNKEGRVDVEKKALSESYPISLRFAYLLTALCDFTGYIIRTIGLSYCGSGLFQVAFSSVAIWSALYSRIILKRPINRVQWLGIGIVTLGLVLSPLSAQNTSNSPLTGILLTLLGAQFYALSYILNEYISTIPGNGGSKNTCKWIGIINTILSSIFILVDTYPNRDTLIMQPLKSRKSSLSTVMKATALYVASHFVHSWALFSIQGVLGAVWTGLLQCVRACVVFVVSGYLYCGADPNQCLTLSKGIATVLVCIGIVIFNKGKSQA